MTQEHPITLPKEQINYWLNDENASLSEQFQEAARIGADQELEACCEWLRNAPFGLALNTGGNQLRAARRPKPPSLKQVLLARVARIPGEGADTAYLHHWLENESQRLVDALHKVIKSLPD